MDVNRWLGLYEIIRADLGFDRGRDEAAASLLDSLLSTKLDGLEHLRQLVRGERVYVAAPGPGLRGEIDALGRELEGSVVIAADAALPILLERGVEPQAVFTDLDGAGHVLGRFDGIQVIHGHGDNMDLLLMYVPRIAAPVVGTVQVRPRGRVRVLGGFTDGDRAVSAACMFGARRVVLVGWNLGVVEPGPPKAGRSAGMHLKLRKLSWAGRILSLLAGEGCCIEHAGGQIL